LDEPNAVSEYDPRYRRFVALFNEREFFDAHEVLEDLWLDEQGGLRRFYQALIQLAAAYLHLSRGNMAGCRKLLTTARVLLEAYPDECAGLDVAALRESAEKWLAVIDARPDGEVVPYDDRQVPMLTLGGGDGAGLNPP
jgi:hypothetical protein